MVTSQIITKQSFVSLDVRSTDMLHLLRCLKILVEISDYEIEPILTERYLTIYSRTKRDRFNYGIRTFCQLDCGNLYRARKAFYYLSNYNKYYLYKNVYESKNYDPFTLKCRRSRSL